jgi:uncharacterized protein
MSFDIATGIICIVFFAIFISATFGFGDALISMPLLTMVIGGADTAPLVALLSTLTSGIIFWRDRRNVAWRRLLPLLSAAILAMPFGFWLARSFDEQSMKIYLGAVIVIFSVYNIFIKPLLTASALRPAIDGSEQRQIIDPKAIFFGGLSGIFGGAYNISGPPVVLYGTISAWSPAVFSATLQGFFFPLSASVVVMRATWGQYHPQIGYYFFLALPVLLLATFVGRYANSKIDNPAKFQKIIHIMLIFIGATLIFN